MAGLTSLLLLAGSAALANGQDYTSGTNGTNATEPSNNWWDWTSPPSYPSPWAEGTGEWAEAYERAREFVSGLTLLEKVNLTTGVGWQGEACVGNVGSLPRVGFRALCLQDGPLGTRVNHALVENDNVLLIGHSSRTLPLHGQQESLRERHGLVSFCIRDRMLSVLKQETRAWISTLDPPSAHLCVVQTTNVKNPLANTSYRERLLLADATG